MYVTGWRWLLFVEKQEVARKEENEMKCLHHQCDGFQEYFSFVDTYSDLPYFQQQSLATTMSYDMCSIYPPYSGDKNEVPRSSGYAD